MRDPLPGYVALVRHNDSSSIKDTCTLLNVINILSGSPLNATQNCPDVILGNYSVNYAKTDRSQVTGSEMNSCNDTTLMQFSNSDTTLKHAFSGIYFPPARIIDPFYSGNR